MFGHQSDKDDASQQHGTAAAADAGTEGQAGDPAAKPHEHDDHQAVKPDSTDSFAAGSSTDDSPTAPAPESVSEDWQHPGVPIDSGPEPIRDIIGPSGGSGAPSFHPHASDDSDQSSPQNDDDTANTPHELIDIKQKALTQLTPLVDQLDQTPEDRFRTTMMMIQASDDQSLVKSAYEAANAIEDEKARAQALLDIVNEINYFTQHPTPEAD